MIDGAHGPGQVPLDLAALGADFYAGNCHKWLCAPKGAGFLYARPEARGRVSPAVVSWGVESPLATGDAFIDELEFVGTRDYAAALAVPAAIAYQAERGWPAVRARCHNLVRAARARLLAIPGMRAIHPDDDAWYTQMEAVELPPGTDVVALKGPAVRRAPHRDPDDPLERPPAPARVDPGLQHGGGRGRARRGGGSGARRGVNDRVGSRSVGRRRHVGSPSHRQSPPPVSPGAAIPNRPHRSPTGIW